MIISDLSHLEIISEEIAELEVGTGSAAAYANAIAAAFGAFTLADIKTFTFASSLPNGGSIAFASAFAFAFAYTPPELSPSQTTSHTLSHAPSHTPRHCR
jgi:hypothetical protein